jgi:hypothetical protein
VACTAGVSVAPTMPATHTHARWPGPGARLRPICRSAQMSASHAPGSQACRQGSVGQSQEAASRAGSALQQAPHEVFKLPCGGCRSVRLTRPSAATRDKHGACLLHRTTPAPAPTATASAARGATRTTAAGPQPDPERPPWRHISVTASSASRSAACAGLLTCGSGLTLWRCPPPVLRRRCCITTASHNDQLYRNKQWSYTPSRWHPDSGHQMVQQLCVCCWAGEYRMGRSGRTDERWSPRHHSLVRGGIPLHPSGRQRTALRQQALSRRCESDWQNDCE